MAAEDVPDPLMADGVADLPVQRPADEVQDPPVADHAASSCQQVLCKGAVGSPANTSIGSFRRSLP